MARRAKKAWDEGQSSPQELEVGPRSGPYLLVLIKGLFSPILVLGMKNSCIS